MKIKVSGGNKHLDLEIINGESALTTFGELKSKIAEGCNLDISVMKIIHRGKSLAVADDTLLADMSFKENDKLLVLGKAKAALKDDPGFSLLIKYEKEHLVPLQQQYAENDKDLTELEKNFLDGAKSREMAKRLEKRFKMFGEASMRHLESMDGLQIIRDETPQDQATRNREKRKTLVNGVLDLLNQTDKLSRRLEEFVQKLDGKVIG